MKRAKQLTGIAFSVIAALLPGGCAQVPRVDVFPRIEEERVVFDVPNSNINGTRTARTDASFECRLGVGVEIAPPARHFFVLFANSIENRHGGKLLVPWLLAFATSLPRTNLAHQRRVVPDLVAKLLIHAYGQRIRRFDVPNCRGKALPHLARRVDAPAGPQNLVRTPGQRWPTLQFLPISGNWNTL
jgi:hypothetical protein